MHKKGDHLECKSFRAITFLNAAYKVLSQIIFRRLSPNTNEFVGSYQAGFIDGRSTTDQIFTVRQILQKCREYQVPMHNLVIDFKAAYRPRRTMENHGRKRLSWEAGWMDGVQNCVRVSSELSSLFESRRRLRQGDGLSCLLFNIALEGVMRRARLLSTARTFESVAELYAHLKREAPKIELLVNAAKTKYMLIGGTEHDRVHLGNIVTIVGDTFEMVEEFVYLESLLTAGNNGITFLTAVGSLRGLRQSSLAYSRLQ